MENKAPGPVMAEKRSPYINSTCTIPNPNPPAAKKTHFYENFGRMKHMVDQPTGGRHDVTERKDHCVRGNNRKALLRFANTEAIRGSSSPSKPTQLTRRTE